MSKFLAFAAAMTIALTPMAGYADDDDDDDAPAFGKAGLLSKSNREDLPTLTLGAGKMLAEGPITLRSGGYYRINIEADGSQELAIGGPGFFRAIWIDEVVINDLEVRPFGLDSFEFDDEGTIQMRFIAIKPGTYEMGVPGARGESQKVQITIE